jgi:hypothetical protein
VGAAAGYLIGDLFYSFGDNHHQNNGINNTLPIIQFKFKL